MRTSINAHLTAETQVDVVAHLEHTPAPFVTVDVGTVAFFVRDPHQSIEIAQAFLEAAYTLLHTDHPVPAIGTQVQWESDRHDGRTATGVVTGWGLSRGHGAQRPYPVALVCEDSDGEVCQVWPPFLEVVGTVVEPEPISWKAEEVVASA